VEVAEVVEDQETARMDVATEEDSKAGMVEDNTITGVVEAEWLVATATITIITTITGVVRADLLMVTAPTITTNITEAIAGVIVVKSRELEISKDNNTIPLLVKVA
jgi:hypothetical protein